MSVSSLTTEAALTRYKAEYSKAVAQVKTLQGAFVTEQERSAQLLKANKVFEAELRKERGEKEALSFRNDQLTKRVENLQKELDKGMSKQKSSRRDRHVDDQVSTLQKQVTLLEEELQTKLAQITELTNMLNETVSHSDGFSAENGTAQVTVESSTTDLANGPVNEKLETSLIGHITDFIVDTDLPPRERLLIHTQHFVRVLSSIMCVLSQRLELHPFDNSMEHIPPKIIKLVQDLVGLKKALDKVDSNIDLILAQELPLTGLYDTLDEFHKLVISANLSDGFNFVNDKEKESTFCRWERQNDRWTSSILAFFEVLSTLSCSNLTCKPTAIVIVSNVFRTVRAMSEDFRDKYVYERDCLAMKGLKFVCLNRVLRKSIDILEESLGPLRDAFEIYQIEESRENKFQTDEEDLVSRTSEVSVQTSEEFKPMYNNNYIESLHDKVRKLEDSKTVCLSEIALLRYQLEGQGESAEQTKPRNHPSMAVRTRLMNLTNSCTSAEKHCSYLEDEVARLVTEEREVRNERNRLQAELWSTLEELDSVRRGYEVQLGHLTQHVAELNERIATTAQNSSRAPTSKAFGINFFSG